jgi:DNA-3-methyladenine glycosylase I
MVKIAFQPQDDKKRCPWCLKDELYITYHDTEWGIPSHDDQHLFEHLILETFQAGLSWHTILKKRERFRLAFDQFDAQKMAEYVDSEVNRLMQDDGIIRYKAKILAAINNAQQYLRIQKEFGSFDRFIWQFTDYKTIQIPIKTWADVQTTTPQSDAMSKTLKKEGFKFVGSTTCMAYMEAVGMVSDHFHDCWRNKI